MALKLAPEPAGDDLVMLPIAPNQMDEQLPGVVPGGDGSSDVLRDLCDNYMQDSCAGDKEAASGGQRAGGLIKPEAGQTSMPSNGPEAWKSTEDEPTLLRSIPPAEQDAERTSERMTAAFGFADAEAVKARVRAAVLKPDPYNVFDFYYDTGIAQKIGKSAIFENITLGVIAANAIWIAVDTDHNHSSSLLKADIVFQVVEHFFCAYFTFEWAVRFASFRQKCDGLKDAWFVFDSSLVFIMVMETWVLSIYTVSVGGDGDSPLGGTAVLRLFRLLRLTRLMRMLRSLPELMILIKGMVAAMRSVCYVMCLLIIITYVFAIAFTQLSKGTRYGEKYFPDVGIAMYSLIIYGTFLDALADFCDDIREDNPMLLVLVCIFICLSALTVMNMLIGVLCEVITAVASSEREERLTMMMMERMTEIVRSLDLNQDGMISIAEFKKIVELPEAIVALQDVGVEPIGVVDFADYMFLEDGRQIQIPFEKFLDMLLDLRGANNATLKDIMTLHNVQKKQFTDAKNAQQSFASEAKEQAAMDFKRMEALVETRIGDMQKSTNAQLSELRQSNQRMESQMTAMMSLVQQLAAK